MDTVNNRYISLITTQIYVEAIRRDHRDTKKCRTSVKRSHQTVRKAICYGVMPRLLRRCFINETVNLGMQVNDNYACAMSCQGILFEKFPDESHLSLDLLKRYFCIWPSGGDEFQGKLTLIAATK